MAQSLLAHLYTRIKGSQEDVATLSLQYILSQSKVLNETFTKQISDILWIELHSLQYTCQVTGENGERPDLAGTNLAGKEQILCEMKFYAGLTGNQPLGYIDRLRAEDGNGLLFVCPSSRVTNLWHKLNEACRERIIEPVAEHCIKVDGVSMAITTWGDILDRLTQVASSSSPDSMSDINQLVGFCAQMDSDAFIPFTSEDLSAEVARKIDRHYEVINETFNLLFSDTSLKTDKKGTRASNVWDGYTRGLIIDDFAIYLAYDRYLWKDNSTVDTPFWLAVFNKDWEFPPSMLKRYHGIDDEKKGEHWGWYMLALEPLTDATLDEVCQDLKRQILEYLDAFR